MKKIACSLLIGMAAMGLVACEEETLKSNGAIVPGIPKTVTAKDRYVVYIDRNKQSALAKRMAEKGIVVIAYDDWEDPVPGIIKITQTVQTLFTNGAPTANIAVVGVKEGGALALASAGRIQIPDMTFVGVSTCLAKGQTGYEKFMDTVSPMASRFRGRVLSVLREGDASCQSMFDHGATADTWETAPFTDNTWMDETMDWLEGETE